MSFDPVCKLGQIFLGVLQEVRGGAMRFQGGIVFVLLVDKKTARIGFVPVYLVHRTTRFLAGVFGQLLEKCGNLGFTPNFRHPGDC